MLRKITSFKFRIRLAFLSSFFLLSVVSFSQQKITVTGTVMSESNSPLSNVSVKVKGESGGTTTQDNGSFNIQVKKGATLVFSIVGFEEEQVKVNNDRITLKLASKTSTLSDVVVIGYGTQRRKDLTGAISSVNVKKIDEVPLVSVDQMLSGRGANVQINQSSGQAGAGTSIRIRGGNSINGTNEPLFVIDGFPIINDNDAYSTGIPLGLTNGNTPQGNSGGALNWLNPADIQSIEILKDASSTAIYGSRGANGVIIITTKKGKPGQARLNLTTSIGQSDLNDKNIKLMNGQQYATYNNAYNKEKGYTVIYKDTTIDGKLFPSPDKIGAGTNWIDVIKRKGLSQNYSLGFSGGKDVLYSGSVSWLNQETPLIGSQYKRENFRLTLQTNLTNWLSLENSTTYSESVTDNSPSDTRDVQKYGLFEAALSVNPAEPVYNSDGSLNYLGGGPSLKPGLQYNPISDANDILNRNNIQTFLDNLSLKATIMNGVNFEVRGSVFNNDLLNDIYYNSKSTFNGYQVGGLGNKNTNHANTYLIENFATVNKTFGKDVFNAVLGYSYTKSAYRTIKVGASGFPNDNLKNENMASGSTQYPTQTNRVEDILSSYYVRFNNVWNDKYILTFTARRDGSSKFGTGNKWALFPSGAFAWKLKEENFLRNLKTLSDLKLRVSYGLSGNQAIQSLQSKTLLVGVNYPIGGTSQTGVIPSGGLGNPNLKWETTKQLNLGLDFGLFNQRLTGSINYYSKKTDDLIQQKSIPVNSGYYSIYDNIGSISNKGIELELHGNIINSAGFTWDLDFNIAHNKQKVIDLGLSGLDTLLNLFSVVGGSGAYVALIKGQPVGEFYGYRSGGIYATQDEVDKSPHLKDAKPGSRKFLDRNGDGQINDKDREVIGDPNPKFTYGINNSFSYKGIDLNVLIQGVSGGSIWNLGDYIQNRLGNRSAAVLDYWTPTHTNAKYPAPGNDIGLDNHSDFSIESASYLRLKAITLGYNLSLQKIKFVRSIRLYASATNILTITNYSGFDPEINSFAQSNLFRNIDELTVPLYKTYTIGLNLGF